MRHDITIDGRRHRLRPIRLDDAKYIIWLRSQQKNSKFIHSTSKSIIKQQEWLESYFERDDDYYFAVEQISDSRTVGLISIYNLNRINWSAEWGRWIIEKRGYASAESVKLIYTCAFEILKLKTLYSRTMASNRQVVRFHDKCGLTNKVLLKNFFEIGSDFHDAFEHILSVSDWPKVKKYLSQFCGDFRNDELARSK